MYIYLIIGISIFLLLTVIMSCLIMASIADDLIEEMFNRSKLEK